MRLFPQQILPLVPLVMSASQFLRGTAASTTTRFDAVKPQCGYCSSLYLPTTRIVRRVRRTWQRCDGLRLRNRNWEPYSSIRVISSSGVPKHPDIDHNTQVGLGDLEPTMFYRLLYLVILPVRAIVHFLILVEC